MSLRVRDPIYATLIGNASTATKLQNSRNIVIGDSQKSFDGSKDITWSLSELGVAPISHTHQMINYTDLSNSTASLDTYNLSSGFVHIAYYYCPTDGGGSKITGRPDDNNKTAFNLKVELLRWASGTDYISKQVYTRGAEKVSYVRYCTNGTWSSWEKIYTSVNKPTLSEIGAAAASHTHNYVPTSTGGNIIIHADSDASTTTEYIALKAGHNILQITSSGGGTTVTQGANKITFNGSVLYHAGNKPSKSDVGLGSVNNWGASSDISANSTSQYATTNMVAQVRAEKANTSHTHSYLPLSGGTVSGAISSSLTTSTHLAGNKGTAILNSTAAGSGYNMLAKMNSTNGVWTFGSYGTNFNFYYTANTIISAGTNSVTKTLTLLNESGNSTFPGVVTASSFTGSLTGNSSTASKLQNARTLTIGSKGKTFDGSADVSWTLAEIGAAASSHTHNYAGSSTAGGAATSANTLSTARNINGTAFNGSTSIVTNIWGTSRNITIGKTTKSVNGSANVVWTLAEIGAADINITKYTATFKNSSVSQEVVLPSDVFYSTYYILAVIEEDGQNTTNKFTIGPPGPPAEGSEPKTSITLVCTEGSINRSVTLLLITL